MKTLMMLLTLVSAATGIFAQQNQRPLRGSGITVNRNFDFKNFDKIDIRDMDGQVLVEVGKTWSVSVTIDNNLESLLEVSAAAGTLNVQLKNNQNNRRYVEDTRIKVVITLPEISVLRHRGNTGLSISGITGRYVRIDTEGNGSITAAGSIDELDIVQEGNGNVDCRQLPAKAANIKSSGNGSIYVNATGRLTAKSDGNDNVTNTGAAAFDAKSKKTGNGKLLKTN